MRNIDKVIAWESINYANKKSFGSGVVRLTEDNDIEFELLNGCHPDWEELLIFILKDKDVQLGIKKYLERGRKEYFGIVTTEGNWGDESKYLGLTTRDGYLKSKKFLVHVSCFGKVKGFAPMYIGDFAELACWDLGRAKELGHKIEPKMWYAQPQELDIFSNKPSVDELHCLMGGDN